MEPLDACLPNINPLAFALGTTTVIGPIILSIAVAILCRGSAKKALATYAKYLAPVYALVAFIEMLGPANPHVHEIGTTLSWIMWPLFGVATWKIGRVCKGSKIITWTIVLSFALFAYFYTIAPRYLPTESWNYFERSHVETCTEQKIAIAAYTLNTTTKISSDTFPMAVLDGVSLKRIMESAWVPCIGISVKGCEGCVHCDPSTGIIHVKDKDVIGTVYVGTTQAENCACSVGECEGNIPAIILEVKQS